MTNTLYRLTAIGAAVLLAAGLAACNKNDEQTAGQQVDSAIAQAKDAAAEAKAKTEEAAADAKVAANDAAADAKSAAQEAGSDISKAASDAKEGIDAAAAKTAEAVGDAAITASVSAGLAKDADLSAIKINVDTKDGVVTLNGPAPSAAAKERAETIAKAVDGVKSVENKLEVKPS